MHTTTNRGGAETIINDVTDTSENESMRVRGTATTTRAKLQASLNKASDVCKKLQQRTVASAKATDVAVREHPYQAVGIAFGIGLLIGAAWMLVGRRRTDLESD